MGVASWLKQLRRVPGVNKARHLAEVAVTPYVRGDLAELRAVTERDIADLQARVAVIEGSQPLVLNAISSTNGVARLSAREMQSTRDDLTGFVEASLAPHVSSIAYLLQRVEMVRAEVLYELRYGQAAGTEASPIAFESKVINPAALEQPDVRLNLGCGHVPLPGFVNVDMRELPGVDVIAVLDDLPVPEGSLAEIFSAHVLEHFPGEELSRRLLPYWRSLLRPGGVFRAVVPDIAAMANGYSSGAIGFETFREVLYGGQEYQGDTHYNGFSAAHLGSLLADAGFEEVAVIAEGRPNGSCLEFEIRASAPRSAVPA